MLRLVFEGIYDRISKLGEGFSSEVLFCSLLVTADEELVDALSDSPSNMKARRTTAGIAIEGIAERTIDSMHAADEACRAISEKRNSTRHVHSHSISFFRVYIDNVALKTQRTVFMSFVDLGCPTFEVSETTRAADFRRIQRIHR